MKGKAGYDNFCHTFFKDSEWKGFTIIYLVLLV